MPPVSPDCPGPGNVFISFPHTRVALCGQMIIQGKDNDWFQIFCTSTKTSVKALGVLPSFAWNFFGQASKTPRDINPRKQWTKNCRTNKGACRRRGSCHAKYLCLVHCAFFAESDPHKICDPWNFQKLNLCVSLCECACMSFNCACSFKQKEEQWSTADKANGLLFCDTIAYFTWLFSSCGDWNFGEGTIKIHNNWPMILSTPSHTFSTGREKYCVSSQAVLTMSDCGGINNELDLHYLAT